MPALCANLSLAHLEVLPDNEHHLDLTHLSILLEQGLIQSFALGLLDQRISIGVLFRRAVFPFVFLLILRLILIFLVLRTSWLKINL